MKKISALGETGGATMSDLKPCPFCGQPVSMIYNSFENVFKIYHAGSAIEGMCRIIEPIMLTGRSIADAREAWNRRASNE